MVLCLVGPRDSLSKLNDELGLAGSVVALGIDGLGAGVLLSVMDKRKLFRCSGTALKSSLSRVQGSVSIGISSIALSEGISSVRE